MTTLYLIRHCEAEGNLLRRCHGAFDSNITDKGRGQIEALRRRFSGVQLDAVYASDLYRARMTALPLARERNLPLIPVSGLRELHMGGWEDLSWGEIAHLSPEGERCFNQTPALADFRADGGETMQGLARRVTDTLTLLCRLHPGQTIAAAFHGTALRAFLHQAQGKPWEALRDAPWCDNTGVSLLRYDSGVFSVEYCNDADHLPDEQATVRNARWSREGARWQNLYAWFRPACAADDFVPQQARPHTLVAVLEDAPMGYLTLELPEGDDARLIDLRVLQPEQGDAPELQLLGEACGRARKAGKHRLCLPDGTIRPLYPDGII